MRIWLTLTLSAQLINEYLFHCIDKNKRLCLYDPASSYFWFVKMNQETIRSRQRCNILTKFFTVNRAQLDIKFHQLRLDNQKLSSLCSKFVYIIKLYNLLYGLIEINVLQYLPV